MDSNSFKLLLTNLKDIFVLAKVKWFFFRELRWFFLSLIIIATLFSLSISFLIGIGSQEIFISENDDVLIISENKLSPTLSKVPSFWIEDINKINGVLRISPETIDIVVDESNQKPVFLRGVTDSFQYVEKGFSFNEGSWFNTSLITQIIIGKRYAEAYNLQVGDKIILNSRTRSIFQNVLIVGIFRTDTASEDGILGSISLAKLMNNLPDEYVNIIRVKFDSATISKSSLHNIIFQKHQIKINANDLSNSSHDYRLGEVFVYSRNKELIDSSIMSFDGEAVFFLPFGTYFFQIEHPNIIFKSDFIEEFVTKPDAFLIDIGRKQYKITSQIKISNNSVGNAEVRFNYFEGNFLNTIFANETGHITTVLYSGRINVSIKWKSYIDFQLITINDSKDLELNYNFFNQINIMNSQYITLLEQGNIQVFDQSNNLIINNSLMTNSSFKIPLLPEQNYKLLISGKINNKVYSREFNYTFFEKTTIPVFLGPKNISIYVFDSEHGAYSNKEFKIWINSNKNQTTSQLTSNATGYSHYLFTSGDEILIELKDDFSNKIVFERYFIEDQDLITVKSGYQELNGQLYSYEEGINNTDFSIYNVKISNTAIELEIDKQANFTGTFNFSLPYDEYTIKITSGNYQSEFLFKFLNYTDKTLFIPINIFNANFFFQNSSGSLLNGTIQLNKLKSNFWAKEINLNNSNLNLNLPFGDYQIRFENEDYYYESTIRINNNISLDVIVSKKAPQIFFSGNIFNSYVKSGEYLNITGIHINGLVYYKWDIYQEWFNVTLPSQIFIPLVDGFHNLFVNLSDNENKSLFKEFSFIIITLGPNLTLLNSENNSFVSEGFTPRFSFSYLPKNVSYSWNNQSPSSFPLSVPNIKSTHILSIVLEFPFNITYIHQFIFIFDNDNPTLISNIDSYNNTFISGGESINLTISENISLLLFRWNSNPYNSSDVLIQVPNSDGYHNLTILIRDISGKRSFYYYYLKVDDKSPIITLLNPSNGSNLTSQGSIASFIASDFWGNITYQWDSLSLVKIINDEFNISIPDINGSHILNIFAKSIFGRITNQTYLFHCNYAQIQLSTSNFVNSSYFQPNVSLQFIATNHNGTFLFSWDNTSFLNQTISNNTFTIKSDTNEGNHRLDIILFYEVNTTIWQKFTYYMIIDGTKPFTTLQNGENGSIQNNKFTPLIEISEPVFSVYYSWNGEENSTILKSIPPSDLWHNLTIVLIDFAGNKDKFSYIFYSNNELINLRLIQVGNYSILPKNSSINVLADTPLKSLLCSWNSGFFSPCSFKINPPLEHGFHRLTMIAEDNYKTTDQITVIIFVDLTPPFVVNVFPLNSSIISNESLNFVFSEQISSIIYSWSSFSTNSTGSPELKNQLSGNQILTLFIQDQASNWNKINFHYFIDFDSPELEIRDYKSLEEDLHYTSVNTTLKIDINDISLIKLISYKWNTSMNNNLSEIDSISNIFSPSEPGFYRLDIVTIDEVNNWGNYSLNYQIAQNWFEFYLGVNKTNIQINEFFLLFKDEDNLTIANQTLMVNKLIFFNIDNISFNTICLQLNKTLFTATSGQIVNQSFNFEIIEIDLEIKNLISGERGEGTVKIVVEQFKSYKYNITKNSDSKFLTFKGKNEFNITLKNKTDSLIRYLTIKEPIKVVFPSDKSVGFIKLTTNEMDIKNALIYFNGSFIDQTDENGMLYYSIEPGKYNVQIKLLGGTEYHFFDNFWEIDTKIYQIDPKTYLNIITLSETGVGLENVQVTLYDDNISFISTKYSDWQGLSSFEGLSFGNYHLEFVYESITINKMVEINIDNNMTILIEITIFSEFNFGDIYKSVKWFNFENQESLDIYYSDELSDQIFENLGFSIAFYAILIIISGTTVLALTISVQHPMNIAVKRFRTMILLGATPTQVILSVTSRLSLLSLLISFIGNITGVLITILIPQLKTIFVGGLIINSQSDLVIIILNSLFFSVIIFTSMILNLRARVKENNLIG
ncbi:MAG: ABC transporter permease [Candidatus Hodarchaeales archaeon]